MKTRKTFSQEPISITPEASGDDSRFALKNLGDASLRIKLRRAN